MGPFVIIAAIRRAVLRLDRNWTSGVLLAAGALLSLAGFSYSKHHEAASVRTHFLAASEDRARAVYRETESSARLLEMITRLAACGRTDVIQTLLDGHRGDRPGRLAAYWISWDGTSGLPAAIRGARRFTSGPAFLGDTEPPWLADAVRRAVRAGRAVTEPASAGPGEELLVFAGPVFDAARRPRGAVLVLSPVADLVESGLRHIQPLGIDFVLEDSGLGGRRLYRHRSRSNTASLTPDGPFTAAIPIVFADRVWTLRASAASAFPTDSNATARWALLAAWLLTSLLIAAVAREVLQRAARVRALVASKGRRLSEVNRLLRLEAQVRREAEQRLNLALDAAGMGIWDWNIPAGRTTASPEIFRIFGLPPAAEFPARDEWFALIHPEDRDRMVRNLERAMESKPAYEAEYRIVRPDGATRWLLSKARLFRDDAGKPVRLLGVNIDITGMREAETALTENQERTRRMFAHATVGSVLTDREGRFAEVSDFACRVTGYTREQLLSMRIMDLLHPDDHERHAQRVAEVLGGAVGGYVAEVRLLRRDGQVVWMRVSVSPAMQDSRCVGIIALWEDVTARKQAEERLAFNSLNDQLTGLPNRTLFCDRLQQALAEAHRAGETVGVIYLDIDAFHAFNETHGQAVGDALLEAIPQHFRHCLRGSDTLARVGGDEFAVVLPHLHQAADAEQVARKLLDAIAAPCRAGSAEFPLTASAGISLFPRHAADAPTLLQHAHTAMSSARRGGRSRCRVFTPELGRALRERVQLEGELRGASERGEIVVHYQPEYDLRDGRLSGFEALARWKHPRHGMVPPDRFIPVAEENGLIVPIGMRVLEEACRHAVAWQRPGCPPLQVAVNVSSVQFFRDDFVDRVLETMERTGLAPDLLQLELTESVVLAGFDGPAAKMARLRDCGVSLVVDDFGTGYSSLSYLTRLPFQGMKIDRSFVRNLHEAAESRAMIQSLVALAHNLNLTVVVEGVERPEELAAVRTLGCDTVQGYLLGRPSADPTRHLEGERRLLLPAESLAYS
ncbi:MAG: EAL domain-containing protein [Acidobacteria bacterium]|nr:EAL domain-containing protein [Acidobacteriota bacterium]